MSDINLLNEMIGQTVLVTEHEELSEPMKGRVINWKIIIQHDGIPCLLYEVKIYDVDNYNVICSPDEITGIPF